MVYIIYNAATGIIICQTSDTENRDINNDPSRAVIESPEFVNARNTMVSVGTLVPRDPSPAEIALERQSERAIEFSQTQYRMTFGRWDSLSNQHRLDIQTHEDQWEDYVNIPTFPRPIRPDTFNYYDDIPIPTVGPWRARP